MVDQPVEAQVKLTCKHNNLILTSPGRWTFAIGLDPDPNSKLIQKDTVTWIDSHNIHQKLTTIRLARHLGISLSRSTWNKADVLAVGRWKRSQRSRR